MLPARLACGLLCGLRRGPAPAAACYGPARWLLEGKCEVPIRQRASSLGRRVPPSSTATEDYAEGPDTEERFLFPEYVPERTPEEQVRELQELRELQQLQQEKERERLQQREERLQQKLRAGFRTLPVPEFPDASVPPSGIYCSGCGAELHCQHPGLPGYLPEEKFRDAAQAEGGPARTVCQRCWLLVHHGRALRLQVSRDQYLELVSAALRRPGPALVLYMVNLLDLPDALLPDLPKLVGPKQLIVLGNKVDLLPQDAPGYLKRLRKRLWDDCIRAGLVVAPGHQGPQYPAGDEPLEEIKNQNPSSRSRTVVKDVRLISAKTGYGVEEMISALQRSWRYRGDVYLVGTTNAGKSTLFNTLLESDYCTAKGSEAIDRATISPWPGTTLNLLKFPICNPTPYRMFKRQRRLQEDATKAEEDLSEEEQSQLNQLKKHGYIVGRVGRTFSYSREQDEVPFEFDADSLAFDMGSEPVVSVCKSTKQIELTPEDVKDAHWFYDTPGITKESCGNQSAWFTVVASNFLPVHITSLDKADALYEKHAGHELLLVPMGGKERMAQFPPLVAEDITLKGGGKFEAVADIKFSSAGWVAVTPYSEGTLHLRGHTPEGTALTVHPPVLPYIVNVKGQRMKKSVAYKTKKPPSLVHNLKKHR
ncbi:nitric oxide-associated protein 1 isoform X1 [Mus musculus]|uniref:nitric oxide-associated protein 1 isoform 3 n=1 Tax=Mus musculus TaxID=10090 RepID=UPI0000217C6F|nr:nitric oxide-associated protein 1 isoform X1 [Mus musculus]|eukprot:XP_006535216.1 PREDICTED: nitric oxide-associated protein 1 isoform X1 [Mus musculus]